MGFILDFIRKSVRIEPPTTFVSKPVTIPVPSTDLVLDAGDVMGGIFQIRVPISGVLQGGNVHDRSFVLSGGVRIVVCKAPFTAMEGDAAPSLADVDNLKLLIDLGFYVWSGYALNYMASLENVGKRYHIPPEAPGSKMGHFYCQAITTAAATIVAGSAPVVSLDIDPDEQVEG